MAPKAFVWDLRLMFWFTVLLIILPATTQIFSLPLLQKDDFSSL